MRLLSYEEKDQWVESALSRIVAVLKVDRPFLRRRAATNIEGDVS